MWNISHKYAGFSQLERDLRTALNLLYWKYSVSLLILLPQIFWGSSGVEGIIVYPYISPKNTMYFFYTDNRYRGELPPFISDICLSKCTTTVPQAYLITFLEAIVQSLSYWTPIPARNYIKNLKFPSAQPIPYFSRREISDLYPNRKGNHLNLILQYTHKKPYESSFFLNKL